MKWASYRESPSYLLLLMLVMFVTLFLGAEDDPDDADFEPDYSDSGKAAKKVVL